ncbi:hypothetical protein ZWY2020_039880 [Hordeum vulgare]|nr:hypothetical protein ZWY2020_039880 [Hordeum vulgare]
MKPESADDAVLAGCKGKLKHFRIKELKDVLHLLGLSKQGKKQELVDKILAILSDQQDQVPQLNGLTKKPAVEKETVLKIVDETFRKLHSPANSAAASANQIDSGQSVKPKKKLNGSAQKDVKVRCPCGNSMASASMIKCDNPQCNVWQHVGCVIISEKSAESVPQELPSSFYCDICRISKADPFWVTINHPLLPTSIAPSKIATDGSSTIQYLEKTFPLSRANREMLQKADYDIQVWCILLDDQVPFRMNWPLHSDMQINGIQVRVVNRQPTQQLGANGRDDGPVLTEYCKEGPNKIVLSGSDSRMFSLGVRIAKRRSLQEVLKLVPKEHDGEKFDHALARVRRCVGGGAEADNADSDSDIEVVADRVSVNLRCPMTGSRIKIAGRFKPCVHMGCFDLEAFVELNQRSRKWQCPICLKNYSLDNIIIDPYFNRITSLIQSCEDDVSEIDVKPDGSWRVKGGAELKDLTRWHLPDGTLSVATNIGSKINASIVKHEVKEESLSDQLGSRIKLGIRKNNNGKWEITKRGDVNLTQSSDGDHPEHFKNGNCITPTSNNDHEDTEDLEPGQYDYPMGNVHDLDSSPIDEHVPAVSREQDIIVLSDSDDDNVTVLSPNALNSSSADDTGDPFPPNPPETSGTCEEQPGGGLDEASFLTFSEDFDDLAQLSFWQYPSNPQDDPGLKFTKNLGEMQNNTANHQPLHEPAAAAAANLPEHGHNNCVDESQASVASNCVDESLITVKNASQKRRNPEDGMTALDASVLDDGLPGKRPSGSSSLPWQQRSVRQRLILAIDSDSE